VDTTMFVCMLIYVNTVWWSDCLYVL